MKIILRLTPGLLLLSVIVGCTDTAPTHDSRRATDDKASDDKMVEGGKRSLFDKNLYFETIGDKRRVIISAYVVRREGLLEMFLCRTQSKEHESILAADVDPFKVHSALIAADARPGSPVRFEPKFQPPRGTVIKVTLQYEKNGRRITEPAQSWVRDTKANKALEADWVFAGSELVDNPLDIKRPKIYLASQQGEGTLICLSHFESAVLDLSSGTAKGHDWSNVAFEPFTERVPELDTKVSVILEPVLK
jgi:hypothetical protein